MSVNKIIYVLYQSASDKLIKEIDKLTVDYMRKLAQRILHQTNVQLDQQQTSTRFVI